MMQGLRLLLALAGSTLILFVAAMATLGPSPVASAEGSSSRCGVAQVGTGAGETRRGMTGHDLIRGRGGEDLIRGLGGDDCLHGGRGADTVKAGAGRDRVRGGRGADTVTGGSGRDRLKGGKANDRLLARDGQRDLVRCGQGNDLGRVDAKDKIRGCERIKRYGLGGGHVGGGVSGEDHGGGGVSGEDHGGGVGGHGGTAYPSLADVDWNGSFDSGCQLVGSASGAWDVNATNADLSGGSTTIERSIVGEGQCAAKFTGAPSNAAVRSELTRSATGADPEFTYELLVYVPSGQSFPSGSTLTQTKQEKSGGGCYNGGWDIAPDTGNTGGRLMLNTVFACTRPQSDGQRNFDAGALPRDRWFALKVHEKFSNDARVGFIQAWKDADGPGPGGYIEVVPKTHVDNEGNRGRQHVRLRIGSYRGRTDHATTLYIDGVRLQCQRRC